MAQVHRLNHAYHYHRLGLLVEPEVHQGFVVGDHYNCKYEYHYTMMCKQWNHHPGLDPASRSRRPFAVVVRSGVNHDYHYDLYHYIVQGR